MANRLRYGMRSTTIGYWQTSTQELWRYNGILQGVSTFDPQNLPLSSAQKIGHAAISVAAVLSPDKLKSLLTT